MIVAVVGIESMARKALGKDKITSVPFNRCVDLLKLDPYGASPAHEAFIFSMEDLTNKTKKVQFEDACASKHPDAKIILVSKTNKNLYEKGCTGVDAILVKPNPEQLAQQLSKILQGQDVMKRQVQSFAQVNNQPVAQQSPFKLKRKGTVRDAMVPGVVSEFNTPVTVVPDRNYNATTDTDGTSMYAVYKKDPKLIRTPAGDMIELTEDFDVKELYVEVDMNGNIIFDSANNVVVNPERLKEYYESKAVPTYATQEEYTPVNPATYEAGDMSAVQEQAEQKEVVTPLTEMLTDVPDITPDVIQEEVAPAPVSSEPSALMKELEGKEKLASVGQYMQEMNMNAVIRELLENNSTYEGVEIKLRSIKDQIHAIATDRSYASLEERMDAINAVMHDRSFYNAQGNTIIEQKVIEIVQSVIDLAVKYGKKELATVGNALEGQYQSEWKNGVPANILSLNTDRQRLIQELYDLRLNIEKILSKTDQFIGEALDEVAKREFDVTSDEITNGTINSYFTPITSEDFVKITEQLRLLQVNAPEELHQLSQLAKTYSMKLQELFGFDSKIIEANEKILETQSRSAQRYEELIVKDSTLCAALNIVVAAEGVGRTIVPYLLTRYRSKQNIHTLCINLSKTSKFKDYGITPISYDEFTANPALADFTVVDGVIPNNSVAAEQFFTLAKKVADYYKYVCIVIDQDDYELFRTIAPDVHSVSFLVDSTPARLDSMKEFIEKANLENVVKRVIVNKCDPYLKAGLIVKRLGLEAFSDINIFTIPNVLEITDGSLGGFNPFGIFAVNQVFEDIWRRS